MADISNSTTLPSCAYPLPSIGVFNVAVLMRAPRFPH